MVMTVYPVLVMTPPFYNRYTYYRLASQMGVESAPEQNKINLNYSNAAAYFDNYGEVTKIAIFSGANQFHPLDAVAILHHRC